VRGSAAPRTPGCGTCLKGFAQNQVWHEIVALACELLARTQMLALTGKARRREPKRLRLSHTPQVDSIFNVPAGKVNLR
jgi:hypothetical protein